MADDSDVLLKLYEEERQHARDAESQRGTLTFLIVGVASGLLSFATERGLTPNTIWLTALLVVLGVYGFVTSLKLYERFRFHTTRARNYRRRIAALHPNAQLNEIKDQAADEHLQRFPRLARSGLQNFWAALHLIIAVVGVALTAMVLIG
jgi:hypothetical protein